MDSQSFVDGYLNHIRANALDLIQRRYSAQQLLASCLSRGKCILQGKLKPQDIVDLGALALALAYTSGLET